MFASWRYRKRGFGNCLAHESEGLSSPSLALKTWNISGEFLVCIYNKVQITRKLVSGVCRRWWWWQRNSGGCWWWWRHRHSHSLPLPWDVFIPELHSVGRCCLLWGQSLTTWLIFSGHILMDPEVSQVTLSGGQSKQSTTICIYLVVKTRAQKGPVISPGTHPAYFRADNRPNQKIF